MHQVEYQRYFLEPFEPNDIDAVRQLIVERFRLPSNRNTLGESDVSNLELLVVSTIGGEAAELTLDFALIDHGGSVAVSEGEQEVDTLGVDFVDGGDLQKLCFEGGGIKNHL